MPAVETIEAKRLRLLERCQGLRERIRLVERSEGHWLGRKLSKLALFGRRYVDCTLARAGLRLSREVDVPLFWGRRIRLPFSLESDFVVLYLTGALPGEDLKLTRWVIRNLKPGDVFYDVGANYGFYTHLACELLDGGEAHAFEPLPEVFAYLRRNCVGPARPVNMAFWDKEGSFPIHVHPLSLSMSTLNDELVAREPARSSRRVMVQCATLDAYVRTHAPPTVIKLDAEGGEAAIIDGGARFLSEASPAIAMELWGGDCAERVSRPAVERLRRLGFSPHILAEDGVAQGPAAPEDIAAHMARLQKEEPGKLAYDNVIFLK